MIVLAACADVVHVTRKETASLGNETKMDGLPFYIKVERFQQSTVYIKTWLRVTLTVQKQLRDKQGGGSAPAGGPKDVYQKDIAQDYAELARIKEAILKADSSSADDALAVIAQFTQMKGITSDTDIAPIMTKNALDSVWIVDQSHTYYLNAPFPWFGTGNLTQELNPDGTLSKASSNPESKVAEGISTLLPLKEFLSGKFVKSGADAAKESSTQSDTAKAFAIIKSIRPTAKIAETEFVYQISLETTQVGHEYTLTKPPAVVRQDPLPPITFQELTANKALVSMKDLGAPDTDKDDSQKIGISGTINLPKDWGTQNATQK
jgi:hypothetical protein